jgi:hypothetical protein
MSILHPEADKIASRYLAPDRIKSAIGSGIDGIVYSTTRSSAVKVHCNREGYEKELAVYRRLQQYNVIQINGLNVPVLRGSDNAAMVIEMSIVHPPWVLDFAQSTLDEPPDFPQEVWEDWWRSVREAFEEHWPKAQALYQTFKRQYGIYHLDLKPRNVNFGDEKTA